MIDLFFIVRTFSYIKLYITFNRKRKYYHKKKKRPRTGAVGKKSFFHLFPKILTIVVSRLKMKVLYFMGMKEPESDFVRITYSYVTQVRNFGLYCENKHIPLKTMYGTFFFLNLHKISYSQHPTRWQIRYFSLSKRKNAFTKILK